jgi:hypothetical protein
MARKLAGHQSSVPCRKRITLGVRKGTVYGKRTREDIYDDIA